MKGQMRAEVLNRQLDTAKLEVETRALPSLQPSSCPHLERWLPHRLDLTVAPNEAGTAYQLVNPIHALHLQAHLESDGTASTGTSPVLFGDEQQRTEALMSSGISDLYASLSNRRQAWSHQPKFKKTKMFGVKEKDKREAASSPRGATESPGEAAGTRKTTKTSSTFSPSKLEETKQVSKAPDTIGSSGVETETGTTEPAPKEEHAEKGSKASGSPILGSKQSRSPTQSAPKFATDSTEAPKAITTATTIPPTIVSSTVIPSSVGSNTTLPSAKVPSPNMISNTASLPSIVSSSSTAVEGAPSVSRPPMDPEMQRFRQAENNVLLLRQKFLGKRKKRKAKPERISSGSGSVGGSSGTSAGGSSGTSAANRSRINKQVSSTPPSLGLKGKVEVIDQAQWEDEASRARTITEQWLERFRQARMNFHINRSTENNVGCSRIQCFGCDSRRNRQRKKCKPVGTTPRFFSGDELMQCLECSFVGCGPTSLAPDSSCHMMKHMLIHNHRFAVTCGPHAAVYCFACGDFVYHPVFDQEMERVDLAHTCPSLSWDAHPIQRSIYAFDFWNTPDHGIVWRGMLAHYPTRVPPDYVEICRLIKSRVDMFREENYATARVSILSRGNELCSAGLTTRKPKGRALNDWRITRPIGLFNLGNTCFMGGVLQCLFHCVPLQRFFLRESGHDHRCCQRLRRMEEQEEGPSTTSLISSKKKNTSKKIPKFCLACETDVLLLKYLESGRGVDILGSLKDTSLSSTQLTRPNDSKETDSSVPLHDPVVQGAPLIPSDLLTAAWRSGQMDHLVGYEQRDCHEFLQAFLDIVSKDMRCYQRRLYQLRYNRPLSTAPQGATASSKKKLKKSPTPASTIRKANEKAQTKQLEDAGDMIQQLFEGTLRSVSICEECGSKRSRSETFLNISLPIQKVTGTRKMSVEQCLHQFTALESLGDPIDCDVCDHKTSTKKQQTFSKLPKILCLHLKRFNAATSKKITEFVSFPATGLDLGPHLPHWSEVVYCTDGLRVNDETVDTDASSSCPTVLYDLFGTVNHKGNLNQGHYVANIKVQDSWFHCNDAHVQASSESDVLKSDGAYVLFYIRR